MHACIHLNCAIILQLEYFEGIRSYSELKVLNDACTVAKQSQVIIEELNNNKNDTTEASYDDLERASAIASAHQTRNMTCMFVSQTISVLYIHCQSFSVMLYCAL